VIWWPELAEWEAVSDPCEERELCRTCKGNGVVFVSPFSRAIAPCPHCEGDGYE
jgi:DnaJ-class molecular chaperone